MPEEPTSNHYSTCINMARDGATPTEAGYWMAHQLIGAGITRAEAAALRAYLGTHFEDHSHHFDSHS